MTRRHTIAWIRWLPLMVLPLVAGCRSSDLTVPFSPTRHAAEIVRANAPVLPPGPALTWANVNSCESSRPEESRSGTIKSWVRARETVDIAYGPKDSTLVTRGLIGFSRGTKRATEVLRCVVRDGSAMRAYFSALAAARSTRATAGDVSAMDGFSGDIWCSWNDEFGFSMTCNGELCEWTQWAQIRTPGKTMPSAGGASANSSSGGYYSCGGNSCEIYQLQGGGYAYDCPDDGDPGSGGGGGGAPQPATLTCPQAHTFGAAGACSLVVPGLNVADDTVFWELSTNSVGQPLVVVDSLQNSLSWSGILVIGGQVTARYRDTSGATATLSTTLSVTPRQLTGANDHSSIPGAPGEIDSCFDPGYVQYGLTASVACTNPTSAQWLFTPMWGSLFSSGGASMTQVLSGPNKNLWYVSAVSARMDLREQLHPRLRFDAPGVQPNSALSAACGSNANINIQQANACTPGTTGVVFSAMYGHVWAHEQQHGTRALAAAATPQGDFKAKVSNLVRADSSQLKTAADVVMYWDANAFIFAYSEAYHATAPWVNNITIWDRRPGWQQVPINYQR